MPRLRWKDNEASLPTRKLYLRVDNYAPQDDTEEEVSDDGRLYDFKFLSEEDVDELPADEVWFEVGTITELQGTKKIMNYITKQKWADNDFIVDTLTQLHDVVHVKRLVDSYLEMDQDYNKA